MGETGCFILLCSTKYTHTHRESVRGRGESPAEFPATGFETRAPSAVVSRFLSPFPNTFIHWDVVL